MGNCHLKAIAQQKVVASGLELLILSRVVNLV